MWRDNLLCSSIFPKKVAMLLTCFTLQKWVQCHTSEQSDPLVQCLGTNFQQAISKLPCASISKRSSLSKPFIWKWIWFGRKWTTLQAEPFLTVHMLCTSFSVSCPLKEKREKRLCLQGENEHVGGTHFLMNGLAKDLFWYISKRQLRNG